jgi:RNA polymerase sigma-70 factor (ECF subfamily)
MKNYKEHQDGALVELTLLGNEKAYEELVIRHEKAVKGTAFKVTGNEYSAEDASQDAFVAAWMHLDSLRDRERFGSWVCSIAKNCARTLNHHYRSCAPDISLHILQDMELTAGDESGLLAELSAAGLAEAQRDEDLHAAVDALSEKIREAIHLHYFEGLSVAQIAAKLDVPEGTVKWRLCEGRKQLRKEYGVMEKTYNENESLVARVMRQVEALKLWRLKNDKTGFEEEYRAVLTAVESLDESKEKHHALADVLVRGVRWVPGERNDEI